MLIVVVGTVGHLWACGARSVMDDGVGGGRAAGAGGVSTPAAGGAGGVAPATGGTGGGFIGSCAYPSCLWHLIRNCQVVGECTEESSVGDAIMASRLCCANGTRESVTERYQGTAIVGALTVTKDGNRCYDVTFTASTEGNTADFVWLDPGGQKVAKAELSLTSNAATITCTNGETMTMTADCSPDGSQAATVIDGRCS
jgi:hypothetical protein